jgi:hypothetical protein
MRSSIVTLLVLAIALGCVPLSLGAGADQVQTLVLRVTATDSNGRVPFEGTIVAAASPASYRRISGRTPYEVTVTTTALHGVLRSKSPDARLKVQLLSVEDGTERQLSWVAGSVVVLGQDNELGQSFVKGYRTAKTL